MTTITPKVANQAIIEATNELFIAAVKMRRAALKYQEHADAEIAKKDNSIIEYVIDGEPVDKIEVLDSIACSAEYMKHWVDQQMMKGALLNMMKDPEGLAATIADLLDAKRN